MWRRLRGKLKHKFRYGGGREGRAEIRNGQEKTGPEKVSIIKET